MKFFGKLLLLSSVICLGTSCLKQSESITPIAPVQTLAEIQKESMMNTALLAAGNNEMSNATKASIEASKTDPSLFYLNMKYNIKNMDVFQTAHIPNSFEQIGNSFLKALAVLFLKISGSKTIDIGTIDVPIPDLNLDFQIVKSIKVTRIYLEYNKQLNISTGNVADFSFINSLSLSKTDGVKLITYSKANNHCLQKCLDFTIADGNILDLISNATSVQVDPTLVISSFPKVSDLKLDGQIDLQIGLKLPF